MRHIKTRRGVALPFTVLAMIVAIGFIMTMSRMNQGVKSQIFHTNNHQLSFLMAYSALSRVSAKVHAFSWANRPFVSEPYVENKVALQGGEYDLLVENSKYNEFQADVYVRTHLAGISRMYFWRIRFNDDLLDVSSQIFVEAFLNADPRDFPVAGKPNPFATKVEALLAARVANQTKSDLLAREVAKLKKPEDIIKELNGRPIEVANDGFTVDAEDLKIAQKDPVDLPAMPTLPTTEKPSAAGPNWTRPSSSYDSMSGINMNKKMANVVKTSESAFNLTDEAWKKIEEKGADGLDEAYDLSVKAAAVREEAYEEMSGLISDAKSGIAEAPSAEAAIAIEEMVSQTIIAGVQNLAKATAREMDQFQDNAGPDYLTSLNTSESAAKLTTDWENAYDRMTKEVQRMTSLSNQVSSFHKDPEAQQALTAALQKAEEDLVKMEELVTLAQQRLQELIKKEAEEEAERLRQEAEGGL